VSIGGDYVLEGMDWTARQGKERKGKERKGKERKGKERKGKAIMLSVPSFSPG
jgi:hypothetical protein